MHSRTARGRLIAGLIVVAAGLTGATQALATVSPASVVRPFTVRYAINTNGDIAQAANTLLTCQPGSVETQKLTTCANAQAGSPGDDNYFDMNYVDVDGDPGTIDSSSANLAIPAGATVLFAGLYWGAALDAGETLPLQCIPGGARTGHPAPNAAAAGSAWLQLPNGTSYVPVNASVFDTYTEKVPCGNAGATDERTRYQAFADVTALVQAGGGGSYTVGNVQAGTGADRHAGWSLVVAYQDVSQPARNLTIFDGFAQVDPNTTVPITVTGFKTPLTNAVNTEIGMVSYEGDLTLTGDSLKLNGTALSDAAHPSGNFFDSTISNLGTPVTTSNPSYRNQLGFDAGVLAVPPGVVKNGDTSANLVLSTTADRYLPGVIWFRTDIYAPEMVLAKTVTDLNGGDVNPGDVLRYDISSTNTGQSSAYDTRIDDAMPANTAYKPGSLAIVASPGSIAGAKTDASGDDQAEFDGAGNAVHFRVGTGATHPPGSDPKFPNGGGVIAPGESFEVSFDVVVGATVPDGTQILNTAVLSSKDENGIDYTSVASAPAAVIVRGVPDVTIDKSHSGAFVRGQQGTFSLIVSNVGGRPTAGAVTADDTLPAGLGVVGATGDGWTCSVDTDRQLAALRPQRRARRRRRVPGGDGARERARERSRHGREHRGHRWRQRDQPHERQRQRHRRDRLERRRRDPQGRPAHEHAAGRERHLHARRHQQRALDRQGGAGLRSAARGPDVRLGGARGLRSRGHDGHLRARRSREGPERADHGRRRHPGGHPQGQRRRTRRRSPRRRRTRTSRTTATARPSRSPRRRSRSSS